MKEADIKSAIAEVVQKLPDLVRADLTSRDAAVRESAEEVVAAKVALALQELHTKG